MLVVSLLLGLTGLYIIRWTLGERKTLKRLPPGPTSKPVIGNLLDLPSPGTPDWLHWLKHKELYGNAMLKVGNIMTQGTNHRIMTRPDQLGNDLRTNNRHPERPSNGNRSHGEALRIALF